MKQKQPQSRDMEQKIKMRIREEERNLFKEDRERRYKMEKRSRMIIILSVVLAAVLAASLLTPAILVGSGGVTLAQHMELFQQKVSDLAGFAAGETPQNLVNFTLYRYLVIAAVGAGLALSGAVYQGSFKNALASPSTLGVQSGGTLGGVLYVFFFMESGTSSAVSYEETQALAENMSLIERYGQNFCILLGCFVGVALIVLISKAAGKGKVSTLALILSGSVFGSIIGGAVNLIQYYMLLKNPNDERTEMLRYMMMGTFDNVFSLKAMLMVVLPIGAGIAAIIVLRTKLNLLVFGEDEARSMGIRVDLIRNGMVAIVTILTAVCLSFCGQIGFVGFIIPHMARLLVGPDFRYLIPASCLTGAISMVVVYNAALMLGYSTNINLMTSLLGGTGFLFLLIRFRRNSNADWA